ncbi:VOC family protein [Paenarthrobacter sp. NPDC057981]|uniref:VOC family protein n=1 Tax=Paenarthrobacter sp. NPDC057981 TaxID=3346297 RepID=UPI0036DA35E9
MTNLPHAFQGLTLTQIGVLVPDLALGIQTYKEVLGLENWAIYTFSSAVVPNLTYRGQTANCTFRIALAGEGPQIELIEPLSGNSVYAEWIEARGYGVHHFGFLVPSLVEMLGRLEVEGCVRYKPEAATA